jgi:hypothetical protein
MWPHGALQGKVSLMQLSRSKMGGGIVATILNIDNLMQCALLLFIFVSACRGFHFAGVEHIGCCNYLFITLSSCRDRNTSEWGSARSVPLS